jgi:hypothetical protein
MLMRAVADSDVIVWELAEVVMLNGLPTPTYLRLLIVETV